MDYKPAEPIVQFLSLSRIFAGLVEGMNKSCGDVCARVSPLAPSSVPHAPHVHGSDRDVRVEVFTEGLKYILRSLADYLSCCIYLQHASDVSFYAAGEGSITTSK